jgi:4-hydroxy-tetrahydrodipicolinate synthase
MNPGCYTALATPFRDGQVDYDDLEKLVAFQVENGITGILAVGTTGESPTLDWEEHNKVIETVASCLKQNDCLCIAGTGSNNTKETLAGTEHAAHTGADAVLLVDPYYNGPSSLEIRREYVAPVAAAFPEMEIIPYVIPGRTGCQLLAEDLALLFKDYPNVNTVKEATGDIENMRHTRACCGPEYTILSGDDPMTFEMMTDPAVKAAGVISVLSNVAPAAVVQMVQLLLAGEASKAQKVLDAMGPLFSLVTVKTTEQTPHGEVVCRARNPLALKTLMAILGMPAGGCRPPLGKMSANGVEKVLSATRTVQNNNPEILQPVADFFNVDIDARLNDPASLKGLFYDEY